MTQFPGSRSGRAAFIEPDALLDEVADSDCLILGAKHDNADPPRIHAWTPV